MCDSARTRHFGVFYGLDEPAGDGPVARGTDFATVADDGYPGLNRS